MHECIARELCSIIKDNFKGRMLYYPTYIYSWNDKSAELGSRLVVARDYVEWGEGGCDSKEVLQGRFFW